MLTRKTSIEPSKGVSDVIDADELDPEKRRLNDPELDLEHPTNPETSEMLEIDLLEAVPFLLRKATFPTITDNMFDPVDVTPAPRNRPKIVGAWVM